MPRPEPSAPRPADPREAGPALHQSDRVVVENALEAAAPAGGDAVVLEDESGDLTAHALARAAEGPGRVLTLSASARRTARLRERFAAEIADGALTVPALGAGSTDARVFAADAAAPRLALMRLPKSLRELDARARELATAALAAGTELALVAGGRVKHMSRSQNEVLEGIFAEVAATRGIGKSRALRAVGPRPGTAAQQPARGRVRVPVLGEDREIALRGLGGVFGGASADAGSRLLLAALDAELASGSGAAVERAVDLGSGNGLLTAYLAAALPQARVRGSDDHLDAVASTRLTLAASGLEREGVDVAWDDALRGEAAASADLVLLNPPFHDGAAIDARMVQELLDAAARVLRPGGRLWMVHNSHLRYRPELERRVGPVRQAARDRRFTVLAATRA